MCTEHPIGIYDHKFRVVLGKHPLPHFKANVVYTDRYGGAYTSSFTVLTIKNKDMVGNGAFQYGSIADNQVVCTTNRKVNTSLVGGKTSCKGKVDTVICRQTANPAEKKYGNRRGAKVQETLTRNKSDRSG